MDTIGDFCTCIRNAVQAGKDKVDVPNSRIREGIAGKLKQYGYIRGYRTAEDGRQGLMRIYLQYDEKQNPKIQAIQRVSKPSRRLYAKADGIPEIRSGYGLRRKMWVERFCARFGEVKSYVQSGKTGDRFGKGCDCSSFRGG